MSFTLSARGLGNLPLRNYEVRKFVFVVGDVEFETTNLCADFVSLKLARLHRSSPELSRFVLEGSSALVVRDLMKLCRGETVSVNQGNKEGLRELARQLEIVELYTFLEEAYPEEITLENALDRLVAKESMKIVCEAEVEFVAIHLFDFDKKELAKVPIGVVQSVLSSGSVDGSRCEEIFALVESLCRINPSFFPLFEFVAFEKLKVESVSRFIQVCDSLKGNVSLGSGVWRSLCKRLVMKVGGEECEPAGIPGRVSIQLVETDPLNGILTFLTQKCGGNVHKQGIVAVTASSYYSIRYPTNIVDFDHEEYFYSKNEPNQWVQYEFKTGRVIVDYYTLKTRQFGGGYHIQSWVVEGSTDGQNWDEINRQENVKELAQEGCVRSFPVDSTSEFRFLRIRQTGPNSNGSNAMTLARFEVFGSFIEDSD